MSEIPQKCKGEFLPMMLDASQTQERHLLLLTIRWVWFLGSGLMPCAKEFGNPKTYGLIERQTIQMQQQVFPARPCSWLIRASALLAVIHA